MVLHIIKRIEELLKHITFEVMEHINDKKVI